MKRPGEADFRDCVVVPYKKKNRNETIAKMAHFDILSCVFFSKFEVYKKIFTRVQVCVVIAALPTVVSM